MLLGNFGRALDREFRLALPAQLREALGDEADKELCLLCGAEPCIVVCPRSRLEALVASVVTDPELSRRAVRDFKRALGGRSTVVSLDGQGRIRIAEVLRAHAGIERNVTVVGVVDAIEIWDVARYDEREATRNATYDRVASQIFA
ncbi:hypothetical protein HQ560_06245 [bacterium]|nr:hypothetical protein [bacterium]